MKILFLKLVFLIALVFSSQAYAGQNCVPTSGEYQRYLQERESFVPKCIIDRPIIKQKNNYNVKQRGSNIIYYSAPTKNCESNCMHQFSKCMENVSGPAALNSSAASQASPYQGFLQGMKSKNIFSRCMSELARCLADCPQESRPAPIDGGRVPDEGGGRPRG